MKWYDVGKGKYISNYSPQLIWSFLVSPLSVFYGRFSRIILSLSPLSSISDYFPFVCYSFLHLCLHKSLLFWGVPPSPSLSPFHLYLFLFVSFFSPSCLSPCEGRLKGVIQPCRQLRISSCRRKLHGVSSLPPSLSSLPPPLLAHLTTQSGWSLSLLSDCDTNYLIINGDSVSQCYAAQAEKGFPSV